MALADHDPDLKNNPGKSCSVGRLLDDLDDTDADTLIEWISYDAYSVKAIWKRLHQENHHVGLQQIGHHRRRTCSCFR